MARSTALPMSITVRHATVMEGVRLLEKSGGRSGDYRAPEARA